MAPRRNLSGTAGILFKNLCSSQGFYCIFGTGLLFFSPSQDKNLQKGEKIAIVGYNGAGKTTLTNLLLRLYDVTDGEISRLISDFLRSEPKMKRDVFIRRYYFFDSIEDIAKRYSFSKSKVKSMLHHTRRKLKDFLIKEGIEI